MCSPFSFGRCWRPVKYYLVITILIQVLLSTRRNIQTQYLVAWTRKFCSNTFFPNFPPDAIFCDHASDVYHEWHSVVDVSNGIQWSFFLFWVYARWLWNMTAILFHCLCAEGNQIMIKQNDWTASEQYWDTASLSLYYKGVTFLTSLLQKLITCILLHAGRQSGRLQKYSSEFDDRCNLIYPLKAEHNGFWLGIFLIKILTLWMEVYCNSPYSQRVRILSMKMHCQKPLCSALRG